MGYQYYEYDGSRTDEPEISSGEPRECTLGGFKTILEKVADLRNDLVNSPEKRKKAQLELSQLQEEINYFRERGGYRFFPSLGEQLWEVYKNGKTRDERINAGIALNYSKLRIWTHEHPVVATMTGIAAASGLGYMLYQYMVR